MRKSLVNQPPYELDLFSGPAGLPMVLITGIDASGREQEIVFVRSHWEDFIAEYLSVSRERD